MISWKISPHKGQGKGSLTLRWRRWTFSTCSLALRGRQKQKNRDSAGSSRFPRQKIHWVFKQDCGMGRGFGTSASLRSQSLVRPQSRLGGDRLRWRAPCTLQKSTNAWMVQMRRSNVASSVRPVVRSHSISARCFRSAISCSTISGIQSLRSRPSMERSSCSLTSWVSMLSKNCCRASFSAEARNLALAFWNWRSAFRYRWWSWVPLAFLIVPYVSRSVLDKLSRNAWCYMS